MSGSRQVKPMLARPSVLLWDALVDGVPIPHGTGAVVVDGLLCVSRIRPRYLWPADLCYELFVGLPVREVLNVAEWAAKKPEEDQIATLRRWKGSKGRRAGEEIAS